MRERLEVHTHPNGYVIFDPTRDHGPYAKGSPADLFGAHGDYRGHEGCSHGWTYFRDNPKVYNWKWRAVLQAKRLEREIFERDEKWRKEREADATLRNFKPAKVWR